MWVESRTQTIPPAFARADGILQLSPPATAFRQIKQAITRECLDLEDALFRVLPIPVEISRAAALQFRHRAAKGFSLLIDGVVSQGWRRATCTISRLVPVFFERNSQFYFMKFNRQKEEDPEPDLVVHVVTIPVAREVLNGDENSADDPGIDIVDYYLQAGLLIYSHLLPDNSKASWERYTAEPALAPNFESLLDQLEG